MSTSLRLAAIPPISPICLPTKSADLLSDPVGRDSVLGNPMASLTQFPGFPLTEADTEAILTALDLGGSV